MGFDLPISEDFTSVVEAKARSERTGLILVPNSNMLRGKVGWDSETYIDAMVRIAQHFHEETNEPVAVMNHEGSSDQPVSEELQTRISRRIGTCSLLQPTDALEAKSAIAGAKLVFSSRYHGCISALASGVLCIGTSWSHKYKELYKSYDAEQLLLDAEDANTVEDLVSYCLANRATIEANVAQRASENKAKSKAFLQKCLRMI
jgi:colanic acid/amylovoran biosynthesis protein